MVVHNPWMGTDKALSAMQAVRLAEQYATDTIEAMHIARSRTGFAQVIDELRAAMTT